MPNPMEQPGLFFVLATLLPLAAFVLLILLGALRWALRPHASKNPALNSFFQSLGGEVPGYGPAGIALAAIALAFLCSLTGFILFAFLEAPEMHHLEHLLEHHAESHGPHGHDDHGGIHDPKKPSAEKNKNDATPLDDKARKAVKLKAEEEALETRKTQKKRLDELDHHWRDSILWARIWPSTVKDRERGTILTIGYRIDMLAAVMFVMVTFIAMLIHLFSMGYMVEELQTTVEDHEVHTKQGHYQRRGRHGRFFMFLSLFCFSMLNLLLADNLFQIFISWELVGICSFLLIGFYYERTSASNAANKAFITNRVGDAGFIIGLLIIWTYFGTFNFEEIFALLRCPAQDAHGEILIDDRPAAHKIIRGNVQESTGKGSRIVTVDPNGDTVLLFPRKSTHLHGPAENERVYDQPTSRQYGWIPYWMLVLAGLGIFLGCVGKSAQFPLQVWLPDAMEGPTPVSALIHAATMVAAGVYLVGRCYPFFTYEVLLTIAYVGAITLFVAASIAVVMTDIKKVLAYSTVSQLGYMMLALGVGGWSAGLLHLLTHAFFKALLFLGSGSVIYGCHHQQDMSKMGGLLPKMKITAYSMLMGVLAIAGVPLFSGWYSKDEILASALGFALIHQKHFLLFLLPLLTAAITTFYMFRMWFLTFTGRPRDHDVYKNAHESPWTMTVPLILLAILSVGVAWGWPLHEADQSWLGHQLHHYSQPETVEVDFARSVVEAERNHLLAGALALAMVGIGFAFALILYLYRVLDPTEAMEQFPGVHRFLTHKWYFDELYSALIVRPSLIVANLCRSFDLKIIDGILHLVSRWSVLTSRASGRFDRGIVDGLANLLADVSYKIGIWLRHVQTGYLRSYVLFLALAAMGIWMLLYAWASAFGRGF